MSYYQLNVPMKLVKEQKQTQLTKDENLTRDRVATATQIHQSEEGPSSWNEIPLQSFTNNKAIGIRTPGPAGCVYSNFRKPGSSRGSGPLECGLNGR